MPRIARATMLASVLALGLAACGDEVEEQALVGGGLGAATALVLDGDVAAGAIIGAGAAVLGCNVSPENC